MVNGCMRRQKLPRHTRLSDECDDEYNSMCKLVTVTRRRPLFGKSRVTMHKSGLQAHGSKVLRQFSIKRKRGRTKTLLYHVHREMFIPNLPKNGGVRATWRVTQVNNPFDIGSTTITVRRSHVNTSISIVHAGVRYPARPWTLMIDGTTRMPMRHTWLARCGRMNAVVETHFSEDEVLEMVCMGPDRVGVCWDTTVLSEVIAFACVCAAWFTPSR